MKSRILERKIMFFDDIRSRKFEVYLKCFPRKKKKKEKREKRQREGEKKK